MEMHHIRYFLAVSETLNLTKAAERCNVAQPALSRAIQALESELGGELLRRERALSPLTELGQRMLPMLRQCYETAHAAKMVAASIKNREAAPLSIAVSHTVTLNRFTTTLRELSRAFPSLQLKMYRGSGSEIAEFLKSGTVELAIAGPLGETWSRLLSSAGLTGISCARCRCTLLPAGTERSLVLLCSIRSEPLTGASTPGRSNRGGLMDDGI
jgi:DNA-binding transcriptional LysR family regulator